jgi:hypothetical protein
LRDGKEASRILLTGVRNLGGGGLFCQGRGGMKKRNGHIHFEVSEHSVEQPADRRG